MTDLQEARYITGDCGHEIYEGETAYQYKTTVVCAECLREWIGSMSAERIADMIGAESWEVFGYEG